MPEFDGLACGEWRNGQFGQLWRNRKIGHPSHRPDLDGIPPGGHDHRAVRPVLVPLDEASLGSLHCPLQRCRRNVRRSFHPLLDLLLFESAVLG